MGLFDKQVAVGGPGSLFNRSPIHSVPLNQEEPGVPGVFYPLSHAGKVVGHALYKDRIEAGPMKLGAKIPVACMTEIHWLMRGDKQVGFSFSSHFPIVNGGGYLLTQSAKAGAAPSNRVETLVKTEDLIIFHYPNHGTLVISPMIEDQVQSIFEYQ